MQPSVQVKPTCESRRLQKKKRKEKWKKKKKSNSVCSVLLCGEQASSVGSGTDLHLTTHPDTKEAPAHRSTREHEQPRAALPKLGNAIKLEGSLHHSPWNLLPLPPQTPPPCPETCRCSPGSCLGQTRHYRQKFPASEFQKNDTFPRIEFIASEPAHLEAALERSGEGAQKCGQRF